ncbi:MAG: hypothetical protein K0U54_12545 [Bacteroidetes bacterium]|nr:hypothetical protein [Bacteroidota bacterium]
MKRILIFITVCLIITSCDDGDIIVTSFDFDDSTLQICGGPGGYLFFKINEGGTESFSLRLPTTDILFVSQGARTFTIDGTNNTINYRLFSSEVTSEYFCNEIPPTNPTVTTEYVAVSGDAVLTTILVLDDNDGVPLEEEFDANGDPMDTDGDGIPNHYDNDDDGDNVLTINEIGDDPNAYQNSDPDDIPDYLDSDDDNDGVATRDEAGGGTNPFNYDPKNTGTPNFLNIEQTENVPATAYIEHSYNFRSSIVLDINNLVLINGEEQITREFFSLGEIDDIINEPVNQTPDFPED